MNKAIIILLFILADLNVSAQRNHLEIENGKPYDKNEVIPVFNTLHEKYDFVFIFRIISPWHRNTVCLILAKNSTEITAYKYGGRLQAGLTQLNLPLDTLNVLWQTYIDNDLLQIKNSNEVKDTCDKNRYWVTDGHSFEYMMLSKNRMKKLSYYMPEFFEQYCPGIVERQKVIVSAGILSRTLFRVSNLVL